MKLCHLIAMLAVTLPACAGKLCGQPCPPGGWGPNQPPVGGLSNPSTRWLPTGDPDLWAVFRGNVQIGGYNSRTGEYRDYDAAADKWGPVQQRADRPTQNHGIDMSKLGGGDKPKYFITGRQTCRDEAWSAIEGLQDDSNKMRLSIIGQPKDRARVLADLSTAPALAEFKGQFLIQAYDPSVWAVADAGFVTDGSPTIYLESPGGRVASRSEIYRGPEQLAMALRKARSDYDPAKDPDLTKPAPAPKPDKPAPSPRAGGMFTPGLIFCAAAGLFLLLRLRRPN